MITAGREGSLMSETRTLTVRDLAHPYAPTIVEPRRSFRRLVAEIMEDPDLAPPPRAEVPLSAWA
jgi:hypothetical protein